MINAHTEPYRDCTRKHDWLRRYGSWRPDATAFVGGAGFGGAGDAPRNALRNTPRPPVGRPKGKFLSTDKNSKLAVA